MRILFSVNGIGWGQATRSLAIAQKLGGKIKFVSWGEGYNFLKKHVKNLLKIDWYNLKGEFLVDNLLVMSDMLKNLNLNFIAVKKMRKLVSEFKPDIIISDTDLFSLDAANFYGIPAYSISTMYTIDDNYNYIPKKLRKGLSLQKKGLDYLLKFIHKRSDIIFYPSFSPRNPYRDKVKIIDLIVREKPKNIQYKKLIYVTLGGTKLEKGVLRTIVRSLKNIKDWKFIITGGRRTTIGNIEVFPFLSPFEILSKCSAVITVAGHSSISEALVYKKPILAIPIRRHVEQISNAISVKDLGCGDYLYVDDLRKNYEKEILEFISKIDYYKEKYKRLKFKGNGAEQIVKYIK